VKEVEGHIRVYQEPQGINYAYATLARATSTVVVSFSNLRLGEDGDDFQSVNWSPSHAGTRNEVEGTSKLK